MTMVSRWAPGGSGYKAAKEVQELKTALAAAEKKLRDAIEQAERDCNRDKDKRHREYSKAVKALNVEHGPGIAGIKEKLEELGYKF
jgi:hypothetical protein